MDHPVEPSSPRCTSIAVWHLFVDDGNVSCMRGPPRPALCPTPRTWGSPPPGAQGGYAGAGYTTGRRDARRAEVLTTPTGPPSSRRSPRGVQAALTGPAQHLPSERQAQTWTPPAAWLLGPLNLTCPKRGSAPSPVLHTWTNGTASPPVAQVRNLTVISRPAVPAAFSPPTTSLSLGLRPAPPCR